MSLVFFISGHGFGHASRDVEVINALGPLTRVPIVIRSAVSPELLARTVRAPYTLLPGACDTGIVQATSVAHDDAATLQAAVAFHLDFPARVAREAEALSPLAPRVVVGDIPAMAFDVAAALGIPSIALGNFTWDWVYETHPGFVPEAAWVIGEIRTAYRRATLALELPFAGGFEIFPRVARVPLVARRPTQSRAATRAHFGLPLRGRVALLSFGGYGMPALDLNHLDCAPDWTIVTTDRVTRTAAGPCVRLVAEHEFTGGVFRYEDLVGAVDVVVTKPGYGIIAECISTGTAMLYTSRGHFREYAVLVDALPRFVRSRFLSQDDLFAGRWRAALEALLAQPAPPEQMALNGADVAAGEILKHLQ